MVLVTISDRGISEPYFCHQKMSVSGDIYHEECIKKHLVPFFDSYHAGGMYYFWPDLATSHYAKCTGRNTLHSSPKLLTPQLSPIGAC